MVIIESSLRRKTKLSLVIAIKDKDRIVFGADKQISGAGSKSHNTIKIWDVPELPGAIMGGVG